MQRQIYNDTDKQKIKKIQNQAGENSNSTSWNSIAYISFFLN